MSLLGVLAEDGGVKPPTSWPDMTENQRDIQTQLVLSIALGLSAFLTFCVLRPKWTELYNARKKQSVAASRLPDLPKTFFGWIPVVYKISNAEILSSAGLDAYAFLVFFRYAMRFLSIALFFSITVILPINYRYGDEIPYGLPWGNHTNDTLSSQNLFRPMEDNSDDKKPKIVTHQNYLWMYVVFVYLFTAVAVYLMIDETKHMIRIRQAYLGTQSTVTDRTLRLSGIPVGMRSEDKITNFVEDLLIGKVDSVMLCRNWKRLDDMMDERTRCLRKLEEAWAVYLGQHYTLRHQRQHNRHVNEISDGIENTALLSQDELEHENAALKHRPRPTHTVRHGFWHLKGEKLDAIDHFTEKLRIFDSQIQKLRQEEFEPTAIAFVTMESTAACQMAVQAILDPTPGQFIASLAPPPADVIWKNTYRTRNSRMVRSWTIMLVIGFLSVFWAVLLLPLAGLLSIEAIDEVLPGLAEALEGHELLKSLVQTGLPTLAFSLLSVSVPYLYEWLSNMQGMTSQGDIDLSVISKNFFFTFFNLFIIFTIFGSAATFLDFWKDLQDLLKDTTTIAFAVAHSLQKLTPFYVNLIILQALGLFPFRLLEFGSVALYPFYLISAKTPRDYSDLTKAPIFTYGFYLPQTMLIFVICIVYSVLPASWLITVFGLVYFAIGGFVYKYQLLYAMEHRQHSTGRAWPMICNRIIMGLIIFHIAMTGFLTLRKALTQSLTILPLLMTMVWFTIYFQKTYFPLMRFIALRSIEGRDVPHVMPPPTETSWDRDTDRGRAVDTDPETGLRYMNPNLVAPLEGVWIRRAGHSHVRPIV